jgi:hypothetical protein
MVARVGGSALADAEGKTRRRKAAIAAVRVIKAG